mmetsp:Transcript_30852/g.84420  ORF Transcript_30852/g.84420 Transcript_30852/m.84420 type:complete len:81 (+) Transcript_30852:163-405(+)
MCAGLIRQPTPGCLSRQGGAFAGDSNGASTLACSPPPSALSAITSCCATEGGAAGLVRLLCTAEPSPVCSPNKPATTGCK